MCGSSAVEAHFAEQEMFVRLSRVGRTVGLFLALVPLSLWLTHTSSANADTDHCVQRMASYVAELDQLLAKEKKLDHAISRTQ
jgi:hypothetical protein